MHPPTRYLRGAAVVKVIVVGNGGVGKSSMAARYCKGVFTDTYKKTIGVDYLEKSIEVEGGETVKLMVWDTAGQEEFDALTSSYYKGAGACAIVFSTTDRASFDAVERWKRKVEDHCGGIVTALVQNKIDLMDSAKMTGEEVEAVARRLNLPLFRVCVKENKAVGEVFEYLAGQYIVRGGDTSGVSAVAAMGDYTGPAAASAPLAPPSSTAAAPVGGVSAGSGGDGPRGGGVPVPVAMVEGSEGGASDGGVAPSTATVDRGTATNGSGSLVGSSLSSMPSPPVGAFKLTAEGAVGPGGRPVSNPERRRGGRFAWC